MAVLGLAGSGGCGSSGQLHGPPEGDVAILRNLVSQMPDASGDPDFFHNFFATGARVPSEADRQRYAKLYFDAVGKPAVNGDAATIRVRVRDEKSSEPPGEVEWSFVKEGDQWKLKTAPLP